MAPLIASVDQQVAVAADVCEDRGYAADPKWSFVITGTLALITGNEISIPMLIMFNHSCQIVL